MNPTKLGRFEIVREIGKGAMGQVFLAKDPKIDRHVAIKTIVIPPGTASEEALEQSERFQREAQAAGKLQHPCIVTIFDVGEEEGVPFIAMEYIEGEPLSKYARPGELLPIARVLELITQAAGALDYAHKNNIVHRDVKPANLMMLADGTLKITDFGLAKSPTAHLTQSGVLLGTPSYMSPEQIQGGTIDGRSDIFSLGAVLYELLTGVRPFEADSISTIIYRILYEDPRPPAAHNPALPPEVNLIIEKALAKSADRRYATGAELVADLRKAFASLPPESLSRPLAGVGAPPPREPHTPRTAPTLRSKERGGRRPGRVPSPRAGRSPSLPGDRGGDATRQGATLVAHRPVKIAALVITLLVGIVIFPRWVNLHEPGSKVARDEEEMPLPGGEAITTAAIGGSPRSGQAITPTRETASPRSATREGATGGGSTVGKTGSRGAAATAVPGSPGAGIPMPDAVLYQGQAAVEISTIPHGAELFLDTMPLADPRVVLALTDDEPHEIVARSGCLQAVVETTAEEVASFKGSLEMELAPRRESVRVVTDPPGARIHLNDRDTRKTTPDSLLLDACEERSIVLEKDGYRPWKGEYDQGDDFDTMVEALGAIPLERIPVGRVLIPKPEEYEVAVYADGKQIGSSGRPIELPEGIHTLILRNKKVFVRDTVRVEVEGGKTIAPRVTLPLLGTLTVQAQPSNCKVYVDDVYVDVTPLIELPIASGGHRVKVVFVPTGSVQEKTIAVDGGKNTRVVVKF